MFLSTNSKTLNSIVVVVLYYFISLRSVAHIVFIEYDHLFLLILLYYQVELRVSTAVWNSSIPYLYKYVHLISVLLYHSQSLVHMSREPINVLLQRRYHSHKTITIYYYTTIINTIYNF